MQVEFTITGVVEVDNYKEWIDMSAEEALEKSLSYMIKEDNVTE